MNVFHCIRSMSTSFEVVNLPIKGKRVHQIFITAGEDPDVLRRYLNRWEAMSLKQRLKKLALLKEKGNLSWSELFIV